MSVHGLWFYKVLCLLPIYFLFILFIVLYFKYKYWWSNLTNEVQELWPAKWEFSKKSEELGDFTKIRKIMRNSSNLSIFMEFSSIFPVFRIHKFVKFPHFPVITLISIYEIFSGFVGNGHSASKLQRMDATQD